MKKRSFLLMARGMTVAFDVNRHNLGAGPYIPTSAPCGLGGLHRLRTWFFPFFYLRWLCNGILAAEIRGSDMKGLQTHYHAGHSDLLVGLALNTVSFFPPPLMIRSGVSGKTTFIGSSIREFSECCRESAWHIFLEAVW
jgi:hypothetical protein